MTAQEARTHIRYSGWASRKVLEAARALPPEDRTKPMSVSHENIAKTLAHTYFADAIWCSRIADSCYPVPSHDALPRSILSSKNGLACRPSGRRIPGRATEVTQSDHITQAPVGWTSRLQAHPSAPLDGPVLARTLK
jgi:hypothetical protein